MFVHPLRFSKAIEATYVEFVRSLKCEGTMFHVCASFSLSPPTYKYPFPDPMCFLFSLHSTLIF
jgi:hypothetical protein